MIALSLFKFGVGLRLPLYSTRSHGLGMTEDARTHTFSATGWNSTSFKSYFSPDPLVEQYCLQARKDGEQTQEEGGQGSAGLKSIGLRSLESKDLAEHLLLLQTYRGAANSSAFLVPTFPFLRKETT